MTDNKYKDIEGVRLGKSGVVNCFEKDHKGCIAQLIQLASTPFEKEAVIEFATIEKKLGEELAKIKTTLNILKYLVVTVLMATVISKLIGG